ncbi:TPA: hypothetical protein ACH3X2_003231 [Trebouxia sp. C0005]
MYRLFMTTGYDLSERQLRVYLDKFGKLSDLYLPKRADGRSKGFVFATFTTKKALSSAMRQPQHVVDGVVVEVKIAAPRPPRPVNDIQPSVPARTHMQHPFGTRTRLYVRGLVDTMTEDRVWRHFVKWGVVVDVSFTNARGRKRLDCCYVTFVNHGCAQRAWSESERNIDGWAFESIGIAGDCEDDLTEVNAGTGPPPPVEACVPAIFQEPCQPDPARLNENSSTLHYTEMPSYISEAAPTPPFLSQDFAGKEFQHMQAAHSSNLPSNHRMGACENCSGFLPFPPASIIASSVGNKVVDHRGYARGFASDAGTDVEDQGLGYLALLAQRSIFKAPECKLSWDSGAQHGTWSLCW